jgi:purine-binding chemotaxis protein CheW
VINLRGSVIPVVDMRLKFNMPKTKRTVNTSIIITEITLDEGPTVIGALVDSVQEVLDMDEDQVEPPPRFGTHLKTEFIKGMGMRGDRFIMILDIEKVFSIEELALVQSVDGKEHSEQMTEQLETAV